MFLVILDWLLQHVPGFIRPAVDWLLNGLRRITDYIAWRWEWLGTSVKRWVMVVQSWAVAAQRFVVSVVDAVRWLKQVLIPRVLAMAKAELSKVFTASIAILHRWITAVVATLRSWAERSLALLSAALSAVRTWAQRQLDRLTGGLADLRKALAVVLGGPDRLAQWLIASIWRALLHYIYANRDRIGQWVTRESVTFTRWLAGAIEDVLVRWL